MRVCVSGGAFLTVFLSLNHTYLGNTGLVKFDNSGFFTCHCCWEGIPGTLQRAFVCPKVYT